MLPSVIISASIKISRDLKPKWMVTETTQTGMKTPTYNQWTPLISRALQIILCNTRIANLASMVWLTIKLRGHPRDPFLEESKRSWNQRVIKPEFRILEARTTQCMTKRIVSLLLLLKLTMLKVLRLTNTIVVESIETNCINQLTLLLALSSNKSIIWSFKSSSNNSKNNKPVFKWRVSFKELVQIF